MRNNNTPSDWREVRHIMVDLETMGVRGGDMILSIGAVVVSAPEEGWRTEDQTRLRDQGLAPQQPLDSDAFYRRVPPVLAEGRIDPGTVAYWMQQNDAARQALVGTDAARCSNSEELLKTFAVWLDGFPGAWIWGNGAAMDNAMLAEAFDRHVGARQWPFRQDRCYRTLKMLFPHVPPPSWEGISHHALSDACWQASHLLDLLAALDGVP